MNNNRTKDKAEVLAPTSVECPECGHVVPELNMALHQATCHKAKQRRVADGAAASEEQANNTSLDDELSSTLQEEATPAESTATATTTTTSSTIIRESEAVPSANTTTLTHQLVTTPHPALAIDDEWSCPQCTLLNSVSLNHCEACNYHRETPTPNTAAASASASADENSNTANGNSSSNVEVDVREVDPRTMAAVGTATTVLSWGLLGGLVGGPVGAVIGGVTGAAMNLATRLRPQPPIENHQQRGFRFTSTSMTRTSGGRATMRVTTNQGGDGRMRTVTIRNLNNNGGAMNRMDHQTLQHLPDSRILQMLVLNAMNQGAANPNQMSYDELLQRFGVGNDHRGATPETIDALPLTKLETLDNLQDNQTVCNVCLEEFQEGEEMRKLHCSHTFHKQCIDRWLSQVASCPVCKSELEQHGEQSASSASSHSHHHQQQQQAPL